MRNPQFTQELGANWTSESNPSATTTGKVGAAEIWLVVREHSPHDLDRARRADKRIFSLTIVIYYEQLQDDTKSCREYVARGLGGQRKRRAITPRNLGDHAQKFEHDSLITAYGKKDRETSLKTRHPDPTAIS
jgi:hypothetical protein